MSQFTYLDEMRVDHHSVTEMFDTGVNGRCPVMYPGAYFYNGSNSREPKVGLCVLRACVPQVDNLVRFDSRRFPSLLDVCRNGVEPAKQHPKICQPENDNLCEAPLGIPTTVKFELQLLAASTRSSGHNTVNLNVMVRLH